jgi:hypothetical protein
LQPKQEVPFELHDNSRPYAQTACNKGNILAVGGSRVTMYQALAKDTCVAVAEFTYYCDW